MKADKIIKERYGIAVEHVRSKKTAEDYIYQVRKRRKRVGERIGRPLTKRCNLQTELKLSFIHKAMRGDVVYLGIAADEVKRQKQKRLNDKRKSPLVAAGWTETDCRRWCEEKISCPRSTQPRHGAAVGFVRISLSISCAFFDETIRSIGR